VNIGVAFPPVLIALSLAVVFGVGARGATLAIGVAFMPAFARLTQTLAASISNADYLAAARLAGVRPGRLLLRHVLPNIAEPLVVNAATGAGGALLAFASLSFLGLGVQPPSYDWGRLLLEGLNRIYQSPAAALGPGVAVVFAGLTFSLLGEVAAAAFGQRSPAVSRRQEHPPTSAPTSMNEQDQPLASVEPTGNLLDVRGLTVSLPTSSGWIEPVQGVDVQIREGEIVGIVGESGSGKSMTALSIAGLLPATARVQASQLCFAGSSLLGLSGSALRERLKASMAVIFQDPMSSLNPAVRVGRQVGEVAEVHAGAAKAQAQELAVAALREVQITEPARRARQYPHEFSGGMRQRAMIAMGLIGAPRLVIADEPTTALDVTVQRRILAQLRGLRDEHGIAVLLISHDMAVISELCERVLVMYSGRIIEQGPIHQILTSPQHPYTRALVDTIPGMDTERDRPLQTIPGRPPHPAARPQGCAFSPRCPLAQERCHKEQPPLRMSRTSPSSQSAVACWFPHPVTDGQMREGVPAP
jgi:oligopeptide/dipeptide ABC transporter ATP-binding protein